MELFYIRNLFSIAIAEEIIKKNNYIDSIAIVVNNGVDNYLEKMKVNMDQSIWKSIELYEIPSDIKVSINKIVEFYKSMYCYEEKISKYFFEKKITRLFLSNILSIEEKVMYKIAKKNNIEVNFYEEGTNLYFDLYAQKNKLMSIIKTSLSTKYKYVYYDKQKFKAKNVYCNFPEKYQFPCCNKILVKLNFVMPFKEITILKNQKIDFLFLSRPLSEDKIISLDEELQLFKKVFERIGTDELYIKFHPRENIEKIEIMKKLFKIKELPKEISSLTAEKIVLNGNVKTLIGYETSTLAYASELNKKTKVFSMIGDLKDRSSYFSNMFEFFQREFPNIKFID